MRLEGIRSSSFYTPAKHLGFGVAAGVLFALCFPPYHRPIFLPLAVALLLCGLHGISPMQGAMVGLVCGMFYFGGTLFWLTNLFGAGAISLCLMLALFIALFSALTVWLRDKFPTIPLWVIAPVLWTAVEWYRAEAFVLSFGWMGLGYALVNAPWLAFFASIVGVYGLSFGMVVLGVLLTEALERSALIKPLFFSCWVWGMLLSLPRSLPTPQNPLNVRLVQNSPPLTDEFIALSRTKPDTPRDLILWPEYSLMEDPVRNPELWEQLQSLTKETGSYLLFGAKNQPNARDEKRFWNTAYLLSPMGQLLGTHVKNHTVHFIQDGVRGTEARSIATPLGRLGVAICFDMDYPDVSRRLAQDGAEVFLVPNMDPDEWGKIQRTQHSLMFQMRAVECGKWLARADVAGGTSVVAPTGEEVARVPDGKPIYLDVQVGRDKGRTLYVRGGWCFPYVCVFVTCAMVGGGLVRSIRRRGHSTRTL